MSETLRTYINKKGRLDFSILVNWVIIFFLFIMIVFQLFDWAGNGTWAQNNPLNPYYDYFQNTGIKIIYVVNFIFNTSLIILIFIKIKKITFSKTDYLIDTILILSILLIWFELWYGSTFYYGEVRDKQGLPFGVNNFGLLGSILFFTYLILRIKINSDSVKKILLLKLTLFVSAILLQVILINNLEESWKLWQS